MSPHAGAFESDLAEADMVIAVGLDGKVLSNNLFDLLFERLDVDRNLVGKLNNEPMLDVGMPDLLPDVKIPLHEVARNILRRVGHPAEADRRIDHLLDALRERPEYGRTGDDNFLADSEKNLRVVTQRVVDQVEMLDYHSPPVRHSQVDCLGYLVFLMKRQLVSGIEMESVAAEIIVRVELVQRRGLDVEPVIVVGQFKPGEQALNEGALARPFRPDHADEQIVGVEVSLS